MQLSISNLAWEHSEDRAIAATLQRLGVRGVEIAPTKRWEDPSAVPDGEARAYRDFWTDHGIEIVAFQSLLFGRPELTLFDGAAARAATLEYLKGVMHLAARLGAGPLVFGSPKSRRVGAQDADAAWATAVEFFRAAGECAAAAGVVLCIEPAPAQYQCDFVMNVAEGRRLVEAVSHAGFGLHLDTAAMHLAGEAVPETVRAAGSLIRHFHVSEQSLAPVGGGGDDDGEDNDHATVHIAPLLAQLQAQGYPHWVSIEMLTRDVETEAAVVAAVEHVRSRCFGGDRA